MKKLVQSSLIALASTFIFSCSTGKYYQFAAKDSAYGYKAPKKEVAHIAADPSVEAATPEEAVLEASAADLVVAENPETNAAPVAPPAYAPSPTSKASAALAAASAASVSDAPSSKTKPALSKADVKKLKKDIKDLKKTAQLDRNLKLALVFVLVGVVVGIFSGWLGGLLILVGLVFGVLWLLSL